MIVTEDDARRMWCPFTRVLETAHPRHDAGAAVNRRSGQRPALCTECQASACMAWRWYDIEELAPEREKLRRGYCGLAGKIA